MKRTTKKASAVAPRSRREYDFSTGVRGKYAKRFLDGTNLVLLDPDVAEVFPTSDAVNDALRALAKILRSAGGQKRPPKKRAPRRKRD